MDKPLVLLGSAVAVGCSTSILLKWLTNRTQVVNTYMQTLDKQPDNIDLTEPFISNTCKITVIGGLLLTCTAAALYKCWRGRNQEETATPTENYAGVLAGLSLADALQRTSTEILEDINSQILNRSPGNVLF